MTAAPGQLDRLTIKLLLKYITFKDCLLYASASSSSIKVKNQKHTFLHQDHCCTIVGSWILNGCMEAERPRTRPKQQQKL